MYVLRSGVEVLPKPWIVRVLDTVFLADLPNFGSNVGIPGRRHSREKVMLDLKIETSGQASRHEPPVRARRFDLTFVPAHFRAVQPRLGSRVTVHRIKVVGHNKECR